MDNKIPSGCGELVMAGLLLGIAVGSCIPICYNIRDSARESLARRYAESFYGDKMAPLDAAEENEWRRFMGVKEGNRPASYQYRNFIDFYNSLQLDK